MKGGDRGNGWVKDIGKRDYGEYEWEKCVRKGVGKERKRGIGEGGMENDE